MLSRPLAVPRLSVALAMSLAALGLFGCGSDSGVATPEAPETLDEPVLVMGVNYWPPYLYPSDHEHAPGMAQVILNRCVGEAGYGIEFRDSSIPEIFSSLQDGSFDLHVLSYRDDRVEYLEYGERPLFEAAYRPFVAADSGIEIDSLDDFDGLRLGHKRNMRYTDEFLAYLEERRAAGDLVELESENEIVEQLVEGEIDVAVMMLSSGMRRAAALGHLEDVRFVDYDLKTASYPVALSKRSRHAADAAQILGAVDECIRGMEASGEMDALVDRYADLAAE